MSTTSIYIRKFSEKMGKLDTLDLYIKEVFDACYQLLSEGERIERAIQYKEQLIVDDLEYDENFSTKELIPMLIL